MCSFSSFDLIWFFILQNFMKFMEMQHAIVVSLNGFFGSWAIALGQSCLWGATISRRCVRLDATNSLQLRPCLSFYLPTFTLLFLNCQFSCLFFWFSFFLLKMQSNQNSRVIWFMPKGNSTYIFEVGFRTQRFCPGRNTFFRDEITFFFKMRPWTQRHKVVEKFLLS